MSIVFDKNQTHLLDKITGVAPQDQPDFTSFEEKLGAAYRLENTIGSMLNMEANLPDGSKVSDFDVWSNLSEDEQLDEAFVDNAMYADNMQELEAVRKQRDRENRDRQILEQGGFLPSLVASGIDPVNFIPVGGTTYKTYKTGGSILTNALATGGAAAASTVLTEAELHRTQLTRTYGESAANVTAAALLGGVLGATPGTISKLFTKADLEDVEKSMDPESVIAAGGNPVTTDASLSAAKVDNDATVRGKLAKKMTSLLSFDPLSRTITSASAATRKVVNGLAENPLDMDVKVMETSVESAAKTRADGAMFQGLEPHLKIYKEYKAAGGTLKPREFNEEVGKAMRNTSDDEFIQRAADSWRKNTYDPLKRDANEVGLLPEDIEVDTAESYLNRIWSKEKINANFPKFVGTVKNWLDEQNANNRAVQTRISEIYEQVKAGKVDVAELENLVSQWAGKTSKDVSRTKAARKGEPTKVTKELDQAVEKILARDLDEADTEYLAQEIAGRITGTPDGRLPYDYKIGSNSQGVVKDEKLAGVFKERSFKIPDHLVEDFLENDIEKVAARYVQQMSPDVELMRRFGSVDLQAEQKAIMDDYAELMKNATSEKERIKLGKQMDADIRDLAAMRDRIRGVYNIADSDNVWVRAQRVMRDLNYMRLLGGVVAASIPDVARIVGAEGIARVFGSGLGPLIKNTKAFKMAAREAKLYGVGTDALMGGRAEIIADVADYAQGGTAFERGVRSAANKFSSVNLMNYWTAGIKQLHAVTMQTRVADDLLKGKYDKRLGQLGISEADAKNMAGELKKHAQKIDGVWVFNTKDWDSPALSQMWGAAIRKESDRVIIVPGQEKPLFMSTEAGKTIGQFKTFMFSATQRVMISTLQKQDKHYIQSVLGLVSLGMMSYAFKQWDAGRELSDDPKAWVAEGIDRSGMLGILMEANNTMEKISGNTYGLRPMLGVSAPASRYASRSALDSAVGPSFGLIGDILKVATAATDQRDWADSDTRAIRRLIPGQNLSILRQGLDKLEQEL